MKVLLIDDNISEYELINPFLNKSISLSVVYNSKQAIEIIKNKVFDLIVIDVELFKENGYEVANEFKSFGIDIVLTSNGFGIQFPIQFKDNIETISKKALVDCINQKALKYEQSNR